MSLSSIGLLPVEILCRLKYVTIQNFEGFLFLFLCCFFFLLPRTVGLSLAWGQICKKFLASRFLWLVDRVHSDTNVCKAQLEFQKLLSRDYFIQTQVSLSSLKLCGKLFLPFSLHVSHFEYPSWMQGFISSVCRI